MIWCWSCPLFLLHDLTYPLHRHEGKCWFQKRAKQQQAHFWGLTYFPFGSHQSNHTAHLKSISSSPHSQQYTMSSHCIQTVAKIKWNPQQQSETKVFFLAHAGTTTWQRWSFPVLNSLPVSRRMRKHFAVRRKTEENQKSLHDLSVIKRLEA